jgi:hypothetical protein
MSDYDDDHDGTLGLDDHGDLIPGPLMDPLDEDPFGGTGWPGDEPDNQLRICCVPSDRPGSQLPGAEEWAPNGNLVLSIPDGTMADFGPPALDLDGDGMPESTLVTGADGSMYVMMDVTGDSLVDGYLMVDAHGNVLSGFELDATGQPVPVEIPEGMNVAALVGADPATPATPEPIVPDSNETSSGLGGPAGNVVLNDGTQLIDLGPATHDFDGDGINESVIVNDETGAPAYVVSELSAAGETDAVSIIDPQTGTVIQTFGFVNGEEVSVDQGGGEPTPEPSPTAGPEKIVAPGSELATNPLASMTYQMTQNQYDIASQVWWDLTGGDEPYPRSATGQPLDPGMVFAMLADRPELAAYKDDLVSMAESYLNGLNAWVR